MPIGVVRATFRIVLPDETKDSVMDMYFGPDKKAQTVGPANVPPANMPLTKTAG